MQNAIKLENISNLDLITSPSSYQCRKTRLVHFVIHGRHINGMYVCVLGIPKGKFLKQMKKKILSYRIIRIKRIFSGVYWCITWTKSFTNLHKSPGYTSINSGKNAFNPIIFTISLWLHVKHFIALTKRESVRRFCFCNYRSGLSLSTHRPVTTKNTGKYDSIGDKKRKKHVYA
jgi:hypothetical protein